MDDNAIIKPFEETLYMDGLEDLSIDFAEIALDELTAMVFQEVSEAALDLPVIKSVAALGKTAWSIGRAVSLRNQLTFIMSLKNAEVDEKAVMERRRAIQNREKWVEKEIETSIIYLDRYTNVKKAVYQARLYCDLINGKINFGEYEEYLSILDQLFISDIAHLLDVIDFFFKNRADFYNSYHLDEMIKHFDKVRCARMESLGLLSGLITSRVGTSTVDRFEPTERGVYLYTVLREDNDTEHAKIIMEKIS